MKRNALIVVAVLAALFGGLMLLRSPHQESAATLPGAAPPVRVGTVTVARGTVAQTLTIGGTLQATQRVQLVAQMPGKVVQVPVAEGQPVVAGQLIAAYDSAELQDNLARAAAGVAVAQAQVSKAVTGLSIAAESGRARIGQAAGGTKAAAAGVEQAQLGTMLTRSQATSAVADAKAALAAAQADHQRAVRAVTLTTSQADGDLAEAQAGLAAAEADLRRAKAGANVTADATAADIQRAEAGLAGANANLKRVQDGASQAEIDAAAAQVTQAVAGRDRAKKEVEDLEFLYHNGGVAGADLNGARTQLKVTQAQVDAAAAQLRRVKEGASPGEVAAAKAQVDEARAGLEAARAAGGQRQVSDAEIAGAQAAVERARSGVTVARETRDGRIAIAQQQAAAAQAQVARAEGGVTAAEQALQRVAVSVAQERAAKANLETARAGQAEATAGARQTEVLAADLAAARAGLAEALAAERLARRQFEKASVTAPVAGVLSQLQVDAGDTLLPGMPLAVIETSEASELVALVTPEQRTKLAAGQPAAVTVEGSDRRFPGQVGEVADVAEADGRTFKVRIVVMDPDLPPGLRATAEVTTDVEHDALMVPATAVQNVEGDAAVVYRLVGNKAQRVEVTLGLRQPATVQITDGLADGEQVVTDGASSLFDGATVEVRGGA